ncbi:cytochrome P450 [Obba rivulosa]|uniref:Cytochrome P450 n=1 Tax=Obba rivulosa TaxID=1052685 RepID=A0A8E2ALL4_9APHY|nr:cytochrome P450 [Obba rivulosa]
MWIPTVLAVVAVLAATLVLRFVSGLKNVSYLPGFRCVFSPQSLWGVILPTVYFNPGMNWFWLWRKWVYEYYGSRTISSVSLFGGPLIFTASADVARQVLVGNSAKFYKSPETQAATRLWGENIISSNFDVYKRHRRIVGPAFSGPTYAFVAREAARLYSEMIDGENWCQQKQVRVESINEYLSKFALGIISRCGFGLPFPWVDDSENHEMSFEKALTIVTGGFIVKLAAPLWAYKFPIKRLREVDEAYNKLAVSLKSLVTARKAELASETSEPGSSGNDLFTRLVSAAEAEGKNGLDDDELIGNVFSFMFAGHETTGHTLSATLALLALYQDEQDKALKQIHEVLSDGRAPTFDDISKLDKVAACFEEAARFFPAGFILHRNATEHVVLNLSEDSNRTLVIPPGVTIVVDMVGIHHDPKLFPDPERFDPSRWYGVQDSELSFFGFGPRACIGRKFALTEGVCLLSLLLRDWKVDVNLRAGETVVQWRERVLQGGMVGLAFGVRDVPLVLTRR